MDEKTKEFSVEKLHEAMRFFKIREEEDVVAFIAQTMHESGEFLWFKESDPEDYERREDLGNVTEGDGEKYIGRGAIQITGRANYKKIGEILGVDLIKFPELAEKPDYAFLVSAAWWHLNNMSKMPAKTEDDFNKISYKVNGGDNGKAKRLSYWKELVKVIKDPKEKEEITKFYNAMCEVEIEDQLIIMNNLEKFK